MLSSAPSESRHPRSSSPATAPRRAKARSATKAELFPRGLKRLALGKATQSLLSYCSGQHKNSLKGTKKGCQISSETEKPQFSQKINALIVI